MAEIIEIQRRVLKDLPRTGPGGFRARYPMDWVERALDRAGADNDLKGKVLSELGHPDWGGWQQDQVRRAFEAIS